MKPRLRIVNLSKIFGTLPAVQKVNLEVFPGEVVGLAGRSGSGKSVLAAMTAGLEIPSGGQIYLDGKLLRYPFSGRALGIEHIFQEPALVDGLDVTTNIFLGNERPNKHFARLFNFPSQLDMDNEAEQILAQLGVTLPSLHQKVANLTSEQRQLIAIARTMTARARVIFVDEPTALLSYGYQQKLLSLIRMWQTHGTAVIFSSNNLEHLFSVSDRIVSLRRGRSVANFRTDETTREDVVASMLNTADHQQVTPAIWAFDSFYRAREQAEKLRLQQLMLKRDLDEQDSLNQQLIDQLAEQVNALDDANIALQNAQRRLLTEREEERKHLARELHDQIIQDLLSTNYELEEIADNTSITLTMKETLSEVQYGIRGLVDDLRRICGDLRPPTIDSFGLGAAIQSFTHSWEKRTGISTTIYVDEKLGRMSEIIELSIFRIVQETLSNIRKHANATQATIVLKHTSPRMLLVSVADNGTGLHTDFNLATLSAAGHYGLLGVSERVALLGGRLKLKNRTGGGVIIEVEIPHPRVEVNLATGK